MSEFCPYCKGVSGYNMTQTLSAKAMGDWGIGYREIEDLTLIKEEDYKCQDCNKSVRNHLKKSRADRN